MQQEAFLRDPNYWREQAKAASAKDNNAANVLLDWRANAIGLPCAWRN
jgi:hypothetical protein